LPERADPVHRLRSRDQDDDRVDAANASRYPEPAEEHKSPGEPARDPPVPGRMAG
jgi:hypothetical protein